MLITIIFISILFFGIAFLVNADNANTTLAGYNQLSAEEQTKIDLKPFLKFYKQFHIVLSLSFLVLGLLLYFLQLEHILGVFLGVYPIVAYIYFMWMANKYYVNMKQPSTKIGVFILVVVLLGCLLLFGVGFRNNKIESTPNSINISGMYGTEISYRDIIEIKLIDSLPKITIRTNGFAVGDIRKGYFKTATNQEVMLFLNTNQAPFLFIKKNDGLQIYYSQNPQTIVNTFQQINKLYLKR